MNTQKGKVMEENNLEVYEQKDNITKIIIELSIYYKLATSFENELLSLRDCTNILNNELEMLEENKTLFSVEPKENIINKLNEILSKNSIPLIIIGTIALALSVNLVELACSLGFPTIFLEILSINKITGLSKIVYLLLYIIFYLIDDLAVFLIAVFAFKVKGISTKYNKFVN